MSGCRPVLGCEEAIALASVHFKLHAVACHELDSYNDRNFLIDEGMWWLGGASVRRLRSAAANAGRHTHPCTSSHTGGNALHACNVCRTSTTMSNPRYPPRHSGRGPQYVLKVHKAEASSDGGIGYIQVSTTLHNINGLVLEAYTHTHVHTPTPLYTQTQRPAPTKYTHTPTHTFALPPNMHMHGEHTRV